jgi:leucyl aminopeptidase
VPGSYCVRVSAPAVTLTDGPLDSVRGADVLALPVSPGADGAPRVGAGGADLERVYAVELAAELARAQAKGSTGEITEVRLPGAATDPLVLLVGIGGGDARSLRRAGAALARRCRDRARLATTISTRDFLEGLLLASYSFSRKSAPKKPAPLGAVTLVGSRSGRAGQALQAGVDAAVATATAVHRARDLANTPANEKDPAWLAKQATALGRRSGLEVVVRDERQLAAEGWGGVLGVGMGSARPPRVIEMRYEPATGGSRRTRHVVLIGKGITFDTGGLSLKRPYESMVAMKTDMAAGGAVIAVMAALRDLGVQVRVTGIVAAAENMPSGSAQRPGDVLTQYGGTTVEVLNTDAEGRLVLADALAYADRELAPDVVVDLATLTGAASLGLGKRHGALYANDDALAAALLAAGDASGDRVWRMPLVEDYRHALDSSVADLCHISTDPTISGGSITAALFLREFAGRRRWAHLDIAGPARADSDEHEVTKGATGFGTRLLLRWLAGLR